eukprot:COSAG01_NODE_3611_length_5872_cov_7.051793_7_plen_252_part_00
MSVEEACDGARQQRLSVLAGGGGGGDDQSASADAEPELEVARVSAAAEAEVQAEGAVFVPPSPALDAASRSLEHSMALVPTVTDARDFAVKLRAQIEEWGKIFVAIPPADKRRKDALGGALKLKAAAKQLDGFLSGAEGEAGGDAPSASEAQDGGEAPTTQVAGSEPVESGGETTKGLLQLQGALRECALGMLDLTYVPPPSHPLPANPTKLSVIWAACRDTPVYSATEPGFPAQLICGVTVQVSGGGGGH